MSAAAGGTVDEQAVGPLSSMLIAKVGKGVWTAELCLHTLASTWTAYLTLVRVFCLLACADYCTWKASSCLEVQQHAAAAIAELGPPARGILLDTVPLLSKLAGLATSGKHPQNVERDLHRAMHKCLGINLVRCLAVERG